MRETFRDLRDLILHERLIRIMAALGFLVLFLPMLVWLIERDAGRGTESHSVIRPFSQALYWMFISGATTGYGDYIPQTPLGRLIAVSVILLSMRLTSVLTAAIASYFVEPEPIKPGEGQSG